MKIHSPFILFNHITLNFTRFLIGNLRSYQTSPINAKQLGNWFKRIERLDWSSLEPNVSTARATEITVLFFQSPVLEHPKHEFISKNLKNSVISGTATYNFSPASNDRLLSSMCAHSREFTRGFRYVITSWISAAQCFRGYTRPRNNREKTKSVDWKEILRIYPRICLSKRCWSWFFVIPFLLFPNYLSLPL